MNPTPIAIISPVPTPYRIHFHRRIAAELPVKLHSLFTHDDSVSGPSRWRMDMPPEIGPVFFGADALHANTREWAKQWRLFRRITAFIVDHGIKLIILDGYADLTRLLLLRWARRRDIPLILRGDSNIHDERGLSACKRAAKRLVVGFAIRQAAGLMPMGSCGQAYFDLYGGAQKPAFLCPYEPDYAAITNLSPARRDAFCASRGLDPRRKRFLYCGRLVAQKRVDVALDAFFAVADRLPDWDLVIAGDGPLRAALESKVPPRLRPRVRFLGFLQTEDTTACHHACDCLVLPSEREPWALVVNEACAAGLAIVCTDIVGAAAELVHENGVKVPPGDVPATAAALERAATHNEAMRRTSAQVLARWRAKADPVDAVRKALGTLP